MYSGDGVYSLGEAARLIGAQRRSIDRWIYGYQYIQKNKGTKVLRLSPPLWTPQHASAAFDEKVIGFRDLLELRIVREFVTHGVPLLVVRRCLDNAKAIFGNNYPFTSQRFATDGRTIFADVVHTGSEPELIDLRQRQLVFRDIIRPSLYAGIEYEGDTAVRWYPESGRKRNVVLDPERQFGAPIEATSGVPSAALYSTYLAEGGDSPAITRTAQIFEIPPRKVAAVIVYEQELRKAA